MRINTHHLPKKRLIIVEGVHTSPVKFERAQLARAYGGSNINWLLDNGYLAEMVSGRMRFIALTKLAKKEIEERKPPRIWKAIEDRALATEWTRGTSVSAIAQLLRRDGGDIVQRANFLDLQRPNPEFIRASRHVEAWQFRRLRLQIIEAERRGLDPFDDASGLRDDVLLARCLRARILLLTREPDQPKWTPPHLALLRNFRDQGRSISYMAKLLKRTQIDVAKRLRLEGCARGNVVTLIDDQVIIEGMKEGLDPKGIAKRLVGWGPAQVKRRIRQLAPRPGKSPAWADYEHQQLFWGIERHQFGHALSRGVPTRGHQAVRRHLYSITRERSDEVPLCETDIYVICQGVRRGESVAAMARLIGRSEARVENIANYFAQMMKHRGRGRRLTDAQLDDAIEQLANGVIARDLAVTLNVPHGTLVGSIRRYKLRKAAGSAAPQLIELAEDEAKPHIHTRPGDRGRMKGRTRYFFNAPIRKRKRK